MEGMRTPYSYRRDSAMKKDSVIKNTDSLPLAMAYVPWQTWGNLYKPEDGLMQGTIFEELDKPFTGRGCVR